MCLDQSKGPNAQSIPPMSNMDIYYMLESPPMRCFEKIHLFSTENSCVRVVSVGIFIICHFHVTECQYDKIQAPNMLSIHTPSLLIVLVVRIEQASSVSMSTLASTSPFHLLRPPHGERIVGRFTFIWAMNEISQYDSKQLQSASIGQIDTSKENIESCAGFDHGLVPKLTIIYLEDFFCDKIWLCNLGRH